jgi:hypothetical protein
LGCAPTQLQLAVQTCIYGIYPLLLRDPCSLCRFLLLALDSLSGQLLLALGFWIGIIAAEQRCQKSLGEVLRENGRIRVLDVLDNPEIRAEVQCIANRTAGGGGGCRCAGRTGGPAPATAFYCEAR